MGKSKLEVKFIHGLILGIISTVLLMSIFIDKNFINKDILKLNTIYLDGKTYKVKKIGN